MAKSTIGRGQFSGRLGGDVFVVRNGKQIIRSYQPVVANPKSLPQRMQRAKGNLIGQISKITPYQILQGLGANKIARRSRFLRLALRNADAILVNGDPNIINASLKMDKFIFSEGAILPTIEVRTVTAANLQVTVGLHKITGVTDEEFNASGALLVVVISQEAGRYESILYRFVSPSEFSTGSLTVIFNHITVGAYVASAYLAPFKTTDGSAMSTVAENLTGDSTDFNALMTYNPSALPIEWGQSEYFMNSAFTPSSRSDDDEEVIPETKKKK